MKQGLSIQELAAEIARQTEAKVDYHASTRAMKMTIGDPSEDMARLMAAPVRSAGEPIDPEVVTPAAMPRLNLGDAGTFNINDNAHTQIANRLKIPVAYYRKMMTDAPHLLANNVNHWLTTADDTRLVRTLDGTARAFMSDRYRVIDHVEIFEAVGPVLADLQVEIASANVTERRLYIKALFPKVQAEVKVGDVVQAGVVISNSEVGSGSVLINPLIYRLWCLNGATMADSNLKRYHVGRKTEIEGDSARRFYKDDTLIADDRAFALKMRDIVRGAADEVQFQAQVEKLRATTERKIESVDLTPAVEVVKKKYNLTENERGGILGYLQRGGDFDQYGMVNAVTRFSQDVDDYDRASELERIGGKLIEASGREWAEIGRAA
jgi:hypothetical protein